MIETFKNVLKLLPAFTAMSITGCLIAFYGFHAPVDKIPTIVLVPIMVAFLLSRLFVLRSSRRAARFHKIIQLRLSALLGLLPVFLGLIVAVIAVCSSWAYRALGMSSSASVAFRICGYAGGLVVGWCVLSLLYISLTDAFSSINFDVYHLWNLFHVRLVDFVWEIINLPGEFGRYLMCIIFHIEIDPERRHRVSYRP